MNQIESILEIYNHRGMSIRQLKETSGLSKNSIKHLIYTSKFIEDTTPGLHGSGKSKIKVFNYTPKKEKYFKRRNKIYVPPPPIVQGVHIIDI